MQRFSKRSLYVFSKLMSKYRDGWFNGKWNRSIPSVRGLKNANEGDVINLYNSSDSVIQSGNFVYVYGCNLAAYAYEEALFYVGSKQAYVNIRGLQANDKEEDRVQIQMRFNSFISPWEAVELKTDSSTGKLFFAVVKLSDDYDGTDDFYYAKSYAPTKFEQNAGWYYKPAFITVKKDKGATHRIFDGSNLPWRLLYPDYYNSRPRYELKLPPARVVLALMKRLDSTPELNIGRYIATVVEDKTVDGPTTIMISIKTELETFTTTAYSPLSKKGDKFRKGQKVLISPFENSSYDYIVINAEC